MDKLAGYIGDISDPRIGGGDTFVDRVSCRYTPTLFLIFALLVTTKNYVGEPIACWCPDHFTSAQVDYTNQVCWVYNTYYLPYDERVPPRGAPRQTIGYYQWVSLLLCMMAVLFYFPRVIWRSLNTKSGVSVSSITDAAIGCQRKMDNVSRDKTLRFMTKHMGRFLGELARRIMLGNRTKAFFYKIYGNYLVFVLLFVKCCYFLNVIGQLFLLNYFLGTKYNLYGVEVIQRLIDGESLSDSRRFPRVTMCDLDIRVLGNVQPYSIMCALPVNLFNEIIFIFIWFWLVFVSIATIASFLYWLCICVIVPQQAQFVKSRLIAMDKLGPAPDHMVRTFVKNYLRNDGILIIHLVAENSSDIIAAELICGLWDHYRDNKKSLDKLSSTEPDPVEETKLCKADIDDVDGDDDEDPKFLFTRQDSTKPLKDNEVRPRRTPAVVSFSPEDRYGNHIKMDEVDNSTPPSSRRVPTFRLPSSFEQDKLKKLKLENERKEKERKEKEKSKR